MIFFQLFLIFSKIGIVGFGGGYAMLSLIQDDVVIKEGWLSAAEGYPPAMAFLGSLLATFSILWLPFILMMLVSRFLLKHKDSPLLKSVFGALRPTVVGLVAAAAMVLMTAENFGTPDTSLTQFIVSLALFAIAFIAVFRFRVSPLLILALAGCFGVVFYSFVPA